MAKKKAAKKVSKKKATTKVVREKKYKDFPAMVKGHGVLSYKELLALKEPDLEDFIECDGDDENSEGHIFACMESGRALEKILKKHNLHVITMSIFVCDDEDEDRDEDEPTPCSYSYSTGFHWVNRERYYLCRKKTPAFCEEIA